MGSPNIKRSIKTVQPFTRELALILLIERAVYSENFEVTNPTTWNSGNDVKFLGTTNPIVGTLSKDILTPLDDLVSLKYVQIAGSLGDWISTPASLVTTDQMRNNFITLNFDYIYGGSDGDINIEIFDDNTGKLIFDFPLVAALAKTAFSQKVFIPADCKSLKFGVNVVVESIAAILQLDNIEMIVDPAARGLDFHHVKSYVKNATGDYTLTVKEDLNVSTNLWQVFGHMMITAVAVARFTTVTKNSIEILMFAMNGTTAKDADLEICLVGTDDKFKY
jgi:hypothetical protein